MKFIKKLPIKKKVSAMDDLSAFEKAVYERKNNVCPKCYGKLLFEGSGIYKCSECGRIVLDDFGKIRKFLDENGTASAIEIKKATGVSIRTIKKMLKNGKLEIPESSEYFISCERCGCDIRYGRFCPDCARHLNNNLTTVFSGDTGEKPRTNGKMRFLDKRQK